jgi:nicotinamidase-related amidase
MEYILENEVEARAFRRERTAILGIHWQVDAVKPDGAFGPAFAGRVSALQVVEKTARVFAAARKHGVPVIYVNVTFWPGLKDLVRNNALFNTVWRTKGFVRGTEGCAVISELAPQPGDYVFEHSRISAFFGTDLLSTLIGLKIETLVFTGVATNVAVDHSLRDAAQLGFTTVLLKDCCCSSTQAYDDAALMTLKVLATQITTADAFCRAVDTDAPSR